MSVWRSSLAGLLLAPASMFAFDVFGDFLYWKASEEPTTLWANALHFQPDGVEVLRAENLNFKWNPGFRVGVGHVFDCDCWDLKFYWTRFHASGKDAVTRSETVIESQFFGGFVNGDTATRAKINQTLEYNMFDGELGRLFCLTECVSFRPYIGLKGGWIDQSIHTKWYNVDFQTFVRNTAKENLTNDFWGIGPVAGVWTQWELYGCFSIIGDFQASFLWGTWKNRDVYKNTLGREINVITQNTHLGSLTLRGFLGLGWEREVCGPICLAIRLGYEAQIWFNQFRIPTFNQLRLHGDLTLQGLTLRAGVEF